MSNDKPITVLGVSESHVATACLLRDGRVVACVSEERLNRVKSWSGFPAQAVQEVLRLGGVDPAEIDRLVLHGFSPWVYGYVGVNQPGGSGMHRRLTSARNLASRILARQPALWPPYQLLRDRAYRP